MAGHSATLAGVCGRFVRSSPREVICEELQVAAGAGLDFRPRYNVCPGENVLAVVREGGAARLDALRWGLVPAFARDPAAGPRAINARAESLALRPAFRDAFRHRRCLIVADGFYEWRRAGAGRTPYFVRLRSSRPFAFAGVWDRWTPPAGTSRAPLRTCAIVTCPSNALVRDIHDRMPVILPPEARARWLEAGEGDPDALTALLVPYAAAEMEAYPVSRLVSSPRHDFPELVRPV
jgi:putative SOS response-associated peptidase YedK